MHADSSNEPARKKRIMVLDDTKPIRILILKSFEKEYDVFLESDGQEALKTVREANPGIDLIILDFDMPKLNGYQFYRLLRRIDETVPVIMVSGSLDERRLQKMRRAGVKTMIAKPVNLRRLREEIARTLAGAPSADNNDVADAGE